MSEQKSAVGPVLLGCGLIGLLCVLVCAGVFVFFVPRMIEQAQNAFERGMEEFSRQMALQTIPEDWRAPDPEAAADDLFPESIGVFARLEENEDADVEQFGLTGVPGRHAIYESALATVDVYVYRVSDKERNDLFEAVKETVKEEFPSHLASSFVRADSEGMTFTVSPPDTSGWLWASQGWMFLILSEDETAPPTFIREYLIAIQPPEEEEDVAPPAEGDPADLPPGEEGDLTIGR